MRALLDLYLTQIRTSLASQVQYRVALFLWLAGMVVEPVVYLVVWTTVARAQGGAVAGFTPGAFAAYYIAWTLVRQMNIALTPYEFEERVQRGALSPMLLRPAHPFHLDLADFVAFKLATFLLWLPVAAVLVLAFKPELSPAPWQVAAFGLALITGFVMRFTLIWALGLATFWITRVSALFELYFGLELLLSGRLVPLALMPAWAQGLASALPFQWSFGFPLELLLGRLSAQAALAGFAAQGLWFLAGVTLVHLLWRAGVRRYSAVGA